MDKDLLLWLYPHPDAESLGLIASRNSTPIIVREDNDRFPLQFGPEHPLTGSKEVIAVGKGKHIYIFLIT